MLRLESISGVKDCIQATQFLFQGGHLYNVIFLKVEKLMTANI